MATDMQALRAQLVETAAAIVKSGAISMSGHGNISIRIPGRDEFIYTAASSLANFQDQHIARLRLDGVDCTKRQQMWCKQMKRTFTATLWHEGPWVVAQCLEVDVASQGGTCPPCRGRSALPVRLAILLQELLLS